LPMEQNKFTFDYHADLIKYWDHTKESTTDHTASVLMDLNSPTGFGLKLTDLYKATSTPANSEMTEREARVRNTGTLNINYGMDRLTVGLGYSNILDHYDTLDYLDKTQDIFTLTTGYRFLPQTSFLLEYNYGRINYDKNINSDADYRQVRVGLKGNLTPKLTGLVKLGYQWRDYDQPGKKDFNGRAILVNLIENISSRTQLKLSGDWSVNESSYWPNNYYRLSKMGLKLKQELGYKWSLDLGGSYQLNKYPDETTELGQTAKRKDNIWTGEVGLTYQIQKWLTTGISYRYKERSSNLDVFDYGDNQLSFKVSAVF